MTMTPNELTDKLTARTGWVQYHSTENDASWAALLSVERMSVVAIQAVLNKFLEQKAITLVQRKRYVEGRDVYDYLARLV